MASEETAATEGLKKSRLSKTGILIICFLVFSFGLSTFIVVRGSWADTTARIPTSSGEGIISQLYLGPDGRKEVRCSAILDYPPEEVWSVITDYQHFSEIFSAKLWSMKLTKIEQEQPGRFHMVGEVNSKFGDWPVDVHINHLESSEKYVASWDEPGGDIKVNRGSWTLSPAGAGKTLVVYSLQSEVARCPNFFINYVLLAELKPVVKAVQIRLASENKR